jgi:4-hydroxy-tetrahydrodipicolinate synthase
MSNASTLQIEGVYTPVVVPFAADDTIDFDTYATVIDFNLSAGIAGLVACGTTGEYYAMTFDERVQVMTKTRDINNGRATIIAGCNAGSTREVVQYAQIARDLGYDAVMLAAPHTSLPTQRELAAHYLAVADAAGLPVVLYNYPARAGVEIGYDCLDAIADHPGIVAIKESSGDFSRFLQLRKRYSDRITIMCGSDDQAVDYFSWGVRSWLAGTANVLPRHHVAAMNAANSGNLASAFAIFDGILPWVQNMEGGSYNAKAKAGLRYQGIECGPVRQPLLPLEEETEQELLRVLKLALDTPLNG